MSGNMRDAAGGLDHDEPSFSSGREKPTARKGSSHENKSLDNGLVNQLVNTRNGMENLLRIEITTSTRNSSMVVWLCIRKIVLADDTLTKLEFRGPPCPVRRPVAMAEGEEGSTWLKGK